MRLLSKQKNVGHPTAETLWFQPIRASSVSEGDETMVAGWLYGGGYWDAGMHRETTQNSPGTNAVIDVDEGKSAGAREAVGSFPFSIWGA